MLRCVTILSSEPIHQHHQRSMKAPKLVIRAALPVTTSQRSIYQILLRAAADSTSTTSAWRIRRFFTLGSTSLILASILDLRNVQCYVQNEYQALKLNKSRSPSRIESHSNSAVPLTVTTSSSSTNLSHALRASNVFRYKVSYCIQYYLTFSYLTRRDS